MTRTMKAAPKREPATMAKVWLGSSTPASWKLRAVAATGEPERVRGDESQPKPKARAGGWLQRERGRGGEKMKASRNPRRARVCREERPGSVDRRWAPPLRG